MRTPQRREHAEHFLRKCCVDTGKVMSGLSRKATLLCRHPWPGNVCELENVIERAVVLGRGLEIAAKDLALRTVGDGTATASPDAVDPFHESVGAFKKDLIRRAFERTQGNQTRAPEMLGLQRTYLARLIKALAVRGGGE
jgi:DNA-binding NtrC family response regulator